MSQTEKSQIAHQIENEYSLFGVEVLHENYSLTIDWCGKISEPHKSQLERKGFEITHERDSIYTLQRKW